MNEKIVFFGRNKNYQLTHLCFKKLVKFVQNTKHKIVLTAVSDDNHGDSDTLEAMADGAGIPWLSVPANNVNEPAFITKLTVLNPTLFITVQFPRIFKAPLLEIPTKASLNIHRGWPLRGGSIDERSIYNSVSLYNIILHHMNIGIDTGNIIGKVGFRLSDDEDGYSLVEKADKAGVKLFTRRFLPLIGNPIPVGEKQNLKKTIYAAKGSLNNVIDFAELSHNIKKLCNAFYHPRKLGALIKVKEHDIYIIPPAHIIPESSHKKPGTILFLRKSSVVIATGDSKISITNCHKGDKEIFWFGQFLIDKGFNIGDSLVN